MSSIQNTDFNKLMNNAEAKALNPNGTLDYFISKHREVERAESVFFIDGLILGQMYQRFALNEEGPYRKCKGDFAKFLVDNKLNITSQLAWQRMTIYRTFADYDDDVIENVKTLGSARAFAICPYVTKENVYQVIQTAIGVTRVSDLRDALVANHVPIAVTAQVNPIKAADDEELKARKRLQQRVYGLMDVLASNQEGKLIGKRFFVPRVAPFEKHEEERFMLIYNKARGNRSIDEHFARTMELMYEGLSEEHQAEIDAIMIATYGTEMFDFEAASE